MIRDDDAMNGPIGGGMHGLLMYSLRHYVEQRRGAETWAQVVQACGLAETTYVPARSYPDAEALQLLAATAQILEQPQDRLLEDFGEFVVPTLLSIYGSLVPAEWRTLELLENVERTIHRVVRMRDPQAQPPGLRCRRLDDGQIVIVYDSPRRLCALARGIIRGVARHYGEQVEITDDQCMLHGDAVCELRVRRLD